MLLVGIETEALVMAKQHTSRGGSGLLVSYSLLALATAVIFQAGNRSSAHLFTCLSSWKKLSNVQRLHILLLSGVSFGI